MAASVPAISSKSSVYVVMTTSTGSALLRAFSMDGCDTGFVGRYARTIPQVGATRKIRKMVMIAKEMVSHGGDPMS